jgi:hypothetical protein
MPLTQEPVSVDANDPQIYMEADGGPASDPPFAETLKKVFQALKQVQTQSEGRIRLQYAYSESEQWFYIVGHIADFDTQASYTLRNLQFEVERLLGSEEWQSELSIVYQSTVFEAGIDLLDVSPIHA